ncbi:MAG: hypothetical protein KKE50_04550 [Nanoarchaeota archaeon]|nr:hypothetical protein [Nanoarchaeota archaeon]
MNKRGVNKLLIFLASVALLISLIVIVSALSEQDRGSLQSELDNLTSQLSLQGYDWLINTSVDYNSINESSRVEVYRENGNDSLAVFNNLNGEMNKIYLTGLGDNESYNIFDLLSGKHEKISYEIIQKKMMIDEIRKELNQEGGKV